MKRIGFARTLVCAITVITLAFTLPVFAQQPTGNNVGLYGVTGYKVNGQAVASQYAQWSVPSVAATTPGTFAYPASYAYVQLGGGRAFLPWSKNANSGLFPSIKILDALSANTETVVPTAVTISPGQFVLTLPAANPHTSYTLLSGSCGLQESINDMGNNGGESLVTQEFYDKGCSASTITAISQAAGVQANQFVHDVSFGQDTWYGLKPASLSLIAAPTVGTISTATTAGSIAAGTYRIAETCIDPLGGESLISSDASSTISTSGSTSTITVTPPTGCGAGAYAYRLYVSAAGGGAGSEILYSPTNAGCTQALSVPVLAACSLTSNSVVTTIVTGTALVPVQATAHTAFALQPLQSVGPPNVFETVYGPFAATGAIAAGSSATAAQVQVPANFFNVLTRAAHVHLEGNTTPGASTGSTLTVALRLAPNFGQSPVTLTSVVSGSLTTTSASNFTCDFDLHTSATGASGTIEPHGSCDFALAATGAATRAMDTTQAASSAVNLTTQDTFDVFVTATTQSQTVTIRQLIISPAAGQ